MVASEVDKPVWGKNHVFLCHNDAEICLICYEAVRKKGYHTKIKRRPLLSLPFLFLYTFPATLFIQHECFRIFEARKESEGLEAAESPSCTAHHTPLYCLGDMLGQESENPSRTKCWAKWKGFFYRQVSQDLEKQGLIHLLEFTGYSEVHFAFLHVKTISVRSRNIQKLENKFWILVFLVFLCVHLQSLTETMHIAIEEWKETRRRNDGRWRGRGGFAAVGSAFMEREGARGWGGCLCSWVLLVFSSCCCCCCLLHTPAPGAAYWSRGGGGHPAAN